MIKINKRLSYLILAIILLLVSVSYIGVNFLKNREAKVEKIKYSYGFENGKGRLFEDAYINDENVTIFTEDQDFFKNEKGSLHINNIQKNDSRFVYDLKVNKGKYYHVGVWIATKDIGLEHIGANISVLDNYQYFGDLRGDNDWTYVEGVIYAPEDMEAHIALRIGGYSNDNVGQAWFDDLTVESFDDMPPGVESSEILKLRTASVKDKEQVKKEIQYNNPHIALFIFLFVVLLLIYLSLYKSGKEEPFAKGGLFLFYVLLIAFLGRLIIAPYAKGFGNDVSLFKHWAETMSTNPLTFYDKVSFCDYPPIYLYIIGFFAKLGSMLHVASSTPLFILLVKLPAILADIASGYVIYKLCGNKMKENWRIFFAAVYVFNPMVILDATIWGQMDSVLALAVFLAVYAASKEQYTLSAFLFGISIAIKPQGLFVGPVLLLMVLKKKDIKTFIKCGLTVILTIMAAFFPYIIRKGPLWIFELYTGTAGGYPYASVNSFNLFTLLGLNWVQDSKQLSISYLIWGAALLATAVALASFIFIRILKVQKVYNKQSYWLTLFLTACVVVLTVTMIRKNIKISYFVLGIILLVATVALVSFIFFKMHKVRTDYKNLPYLTALLLSVWVVMFTVRMHERYIFPALIFALILAIKDNSRFMFKIYALISATTYFNSLTILGRINSGGSISNFSGNDYVVIISALNVLAAVLAGIYAFGLFRNNSRYDFLIPVMEQEDSSKASNVNN